MSIIEKKIPKKLIRSWEKSTIRIQESDERVGLRAFLDHVSDSIACTESALSTNYDRYESIYNTSSDEESSKESNRRKKHTGRALKVDTKNKDSRNKKVKKNDCLFCDKEHELVSVCPEFKKMTMQQFIGKAMTPTGVFGIKILLLLKILCYMILLQIQTPFGIHS